MQQGVAGQSASQPVLQVNGLTRRFGENIAVNEVSFDVMRGEIHGLIGHNGAGKSTVINMLTGQLQADSGTIILDGVTVQFRNRRAAARQGISLVDQELSLVPALSIVENMRLGGVRQPGNTREKRARDSELLASVGLNDIDLDVRVEELSLGERQLVEIARALGQQPRVMILDEPTATLSETESQFVYAAIRKVAARGCAVIFVSHRLGEVLALCDRATVLRDARWVSTQDTAGTTVAQLLEDMLGEVPQNARKRAINTEAESVVTIRNLTVERRFEDFSLELKPATVYALAGQVGSGASEVLRALAGLHNDTTGSVQIEGKDVSLHDPVGSVKRGIVFVSNDRKSEGLFLHQSIFSNLLVTRLPSVSRFGVVESSRQQAEASALTDLVGIPRERRKQPVSALSGGNQQKVFIGRTLLRDSTRVLLIDEPTRGVDVGGRAAIHDLIRHAADKGVTVVFASTELEELLDLADVVVTMKDGRIVRTHTDTVSGSTLMQDMTHSEGAAS